MSLYFFQASLYPGKDGVNTTTPDEFWQTLLKGEDIRTTPPNARWGTNIPASHPMRGTYITNAEEFAPEHFGLSETEAVDMDAQQRLSIQVAYECLGNAGFLGENGKVKPEKEDVGVYVGIALAEGLTTCMQVCLKGMFKLHRNSRQSCVLLSCFINLETYQ